MKQKEKYPSILLELEPLLNEAPELEESFTITPFEEPSITLILPKAKGLEGLKELLEAIRPAQCRVYLIGKEGLYPKWPLEEEDIKSLVNSITRNFIEANKISPAEAEPLLDAKINELIELLRKEQGN